MSVTVTEGAGGSIAAGMTFGSLFAGIGGLDLGLELAGWQCSWQVETDPRCNSVLAKHWPDVRRYGDIKEIKPGQVEAVDLISAGWPCQDLSVAGKRGGLAAERSGLFFQAVRIIQGLQPQWLLLEQVPGLFSQNKGQDFVLVIQALAECGYGFMWRVLNSQYFGVAQRRRRVFIVGRLRDVARLGQSQSRQDPPRLAGLHPEVLFESESLSRNTAPCGEPGKGIAAPLKASSPSRRAGGSWPIAEEFVVADPAYTLAASVRGTGDGHGQGWNSNYIVQHALSGHNQRNDPDGEHFVVAYNWQSGGDVRLSFGKPNLQAGQVPAVGVRRLSPTECERLQGFPDGWTQGQADSTRYRQLGNAVTVNVAQWIGERIAKADGAVMKG